MKSFLADNGGRCVHGILTVPAKRICRQAMSATVCNDVPGLPIASGGLTRSITMPMVSAKRTGLCGVLPETS
jgi:hypothetical protein